MKIKAYINILKRKSFFLMLFSLIAFEINAQQSVSNTNGKISGRIVDSASGQPVEFASISLSVQGTDKEIDGMMADDKGAFELTNIAAGTYKLQIFSIGYKSGVKNNIVVSKANPEVNVGDIRLVNTTSKLAAVTVAADKNTVQYEVDKMVYNVTKDMTSQSSVATDVLKKIPEIEVDVDGNVELQGDADIRFLINGKPSTVFGNNLADVLQSIPASQIESIEVITSPGAKYDAEGTAGIINIVLKKSDAEGINGSVSLSGGTRLENGSFNLNARKGKFGAHAFLSGNGQLTSTTQNSITSSGQDTGSTTSQLTQNGPSNFRRDGYESGIGFDWEITPKNTISGEVGYDFFENNNAGTLNGETILRDESGNILSDEDDLLNTSSSFHQQTIDWNIDYRHTFHKKDEDLEMLVTSSTSNNYSYYMQSQQHLSNDSIFNGSYGNNPGISQETDISVDYADPLTKNISLETGAKTVLQDITSTSDVYLLDPTSDYYDYNAEQSSSLNYKNNIYAGYVSGKFKFFHWLNAVVGTRYEYTQINAYFSNSGNVDVQPYGILVPSAIFSHAFKNNQTLKISYSHRVERPSYTKLNPFINASNPENITTGNPALLPEIGDKVELGYNKILPKGGNIFLTLFYRLNTHDLQPYTIYYPTYKAGDSTYTNVSVTTPANIGSEKNIGMNIFGSIPIKKKITLRSNISLFQRYINTGFSTGGNVSGFNYRINLNGTYKISKTITVEVFGNFNSPRVNAQGTYPAFFTYNFAIRKQLFNGKGSIAATATNPFNYYINQTANIVGENFTLINTRDLPYQSFGFNFTYTFGKLQFKDEKEPEDKNLNPPDEEN